MGYIADQPLVADHQQFEETGRFVFVLVITHDHGTDIYACETAELAWDIAWEYADEWWDREINANVPRPADKHDMVRAYFDIAYGEWFAIERSEVMKAKGDHT